MERRRRVLAPKKFESQGCLACRRQPWRANDCGCGKPLPAARTLASAELSASRGTARALREMTTPCIRVSALLFG